MLDFTSPQHRGGDLFLPRALWEFTTPDTALPLGHVASGAGPSSEGKGLPGHWYLGGTG